MKPFRTLPWLGTSAVACWISFSALSAQSKPFDDANWSPAASRNLSVHVVTFQVPSATALLALDTATHDDGALFNQLTDMVSAGTAELVGDQSLAARSGQRTKVEAISELIYPTEWQLFSKTPLLPATTHNTRNLGDTFEIEPVVSAMEPVIDSRVSVESVRWKRNEAIPIVLPRENSWLPGQLVSPLIVAKKISAALTSTNGVPLLTGILPAGDVYDHNLIAGHDARLTFIINQQAHAVPSAPPPVREDFSHFRLHTLGFRVPGDLAASWLMDSAVTEAERLEMALALCREGKATLIHHAAVGGRSGQRCKIESVAEVIFSRTFNEDVMETQLAGSILEVEPSLDETGRLLEVQLSVEETGRPVWETVRTEAGSNGSGPALPAFPRVRSLAAVALPVGGVRLLSVAGATPADTAYGRESGTADVFFLKRAGASGATAPPPPSNGRRGIRVQGLLYSLNEAEAAAAQRIMEDTEARREVAREIEERWRAGECALLAPVAISTISGQRVELKSGVDRVLSATFAPEGDKRSWFQKLHWRTVGMSFEATPTFKPDEGGVSLTLACAYDAAPALWPKAAHTREVEIEMTPPNGKTWISKAAGLEFAATESLETFTLTEEESFADGETRLVAVQPSRAPFGPEAGRWHALVVRVDFR